MKLKSEFLTTECICRKNWFFYYCDGIVSVRMKFMDYTKKESYSRFKKIVEKEYNDIFFNKGGKK